MPAALDAESRGTLADDLAQCARALHPEAEAAHATDPA